MDLKHFGVIALFALSLVGCASPYHSPYGSGYPGMYGPPPNVPNGATFPPGTMSPTSLHGTSIAPTYGTNTPNAPTPADSKTTDAPKYNSTGGGGVPGYDDPTINNDQPDPFFKEAKENTGPFSSINTPPAPSGNMELVNGEDENYQTPFINQADYNK